MKRRLQTGYTSQDKRARIDMQYSDTQQITEILKKRGAMIGERDLTGNGTLRASPSYASITKSRSNCQGSHRSKKCKRYHRPMIRLLTREFRHSDPSNSDQSLRELVAQGTISRIFRECRSKVFARQNDTSAAGSLYGLGDALQFPARTFGGLQVLESSMIPNIKRDLHPHSGRTSLPPAKPEGEKEIPPNANEMKGMLPEPRDDAKGHMSPPSTDEVNYSDESPESGVDSEKEFFSTGDTCPFGGSQASKSSMVPKVRRDSRPHSGRNSQPPDDAEGEKEMSLNANDEGLVLEKGEMKDMLPEPRDDSKGQMSPPSTDEVNHSDKFPKSGVGSDQKFFSTGDAYVVPFNFMPTTSYSSFSPQSKTNTCASDVHQGSFRPRSQISVICHRKAFESSNLGSRSRTCIYANNYSPIRPQVNRGPLMAPFDTGLSFGSWPDSSSSNAQAYQMTPVLYPGASLCLPFDFMQETGPVRKHVPPLYVGTASLPDFLGSAARTIFSMAANFFLRWKSDVSVRDNNVVSSPPSPRSSRGSNPSIPCNRMGNFRLATLPPRRKHTILSKSSPSLLYAPLNHSSPLPLPPFPNRTFFSTNHKSPGLNEQETDGSAASIFLASSGRPDFVKNPSGISFMPDGWENIFQPKTGEWKCETCYYINPAEAMTCDMCTALKEAAQSTITSGPKDPSDGVPNKVQSGQKVVSQSGIYSSYYFDEGDHGVCPDDMGKEASDLTNVLCSEEAGSTAISKKGIRVNNGVCDLDGDSNAIKEAEVNRDTDGASTKRIKMNSLGNLRSVGGNDSRRSMRRSPEPLDSLENGNAGHSKRVKAEGTQGLNDDSRGSVEMPEGDFPHLSCSKKRNKSEVDDDDEDLNQVSKAARENVDGMAMDDTRIHYVSPTKVTMDVDSPSSMPKQK